ncbi:MAG: fluoride efflux transporter CrcB [Wolinella sp.]
MQTLLAIFVGAGFGALLRWFLGLKLNALAPLIPLGTLGANWLGGYLIGLALAFFSTHPLLSPEWRLLIITGFLGGLTTFSTFSAEMVSLLQGGRYGALALGVALHVGGSITMTLLGIFTFSFIQRIGG